MNPLDSFIDGVQNMLNFFKEDPGVKLTLISTVYSGICHSYEFDHPYKGMATQYVMFNLTIPATSGVKVIFHREPSERWQIGFDLWYEMPPMRVLTPDSTLYASMVEMRSTMVNYPL